MSNKNPKINTTNLLYPISRSAAGFGEWEHSLVPHTHHLMHLPVRGFQFRPDLDGLIKDQSGRPVVEVQGVDGPGIFTVGNAAPQVLSGWEKACAGATA